MTARPVEIGRLELVEIPDADHAVLEAECGKGTYVRSLARDIGRALGCFGHVSALRRVAVGPFGPETMISLEDLEALCHRAAAGEGSLADALMPVETALDDIPALAVSAGRCGKARNAAKPFCCADGTLPFSAARSMSRWRASSWPLPKWTAAKSSPSACSTWPA